MLALLAFYMLFVFDTSSQTIIFSAQEINTKDDPSEGMLIR